MTLAEDISKWFLEARGLNIDPKDLPTLRSMAQAVAPELRRDGIDPGPLFMTGIMLGGASGDRTVVTAGGLLMASPDLSHVPLRAPPDGLVLRPFQEEGARFILTNKRVILADEMGLGKTVTTITAFRTAGLYPLLVITPAILKENWRREIGRWDPGRKVAVLSGRSPDPSLLAGAEYVVVNYEVLEAWAPHLKPMGFKGMACDEAAHYLQSHKTKRSKLVKSMRFNVPLRVALTGTPILNDPRDMIGPLTFIDRLDDFGGWYGFVTEYLGYSPRWPRLDNPRNLVKLGNIARRGVLIRHTKAQVLKELPPKTYSFVPIDLGGMGIKLAVSHREYLAKVKEHEDKGEKDGIGDIAGFQRLRHDVGLAKVPAVLDWCETFLRDTDQKLLVFAYHNDVLDGLIKGLEAHAPVTLLGGMSDHARQAVVDAFQTDPKVRVAVCSIMASGLGLTLTAASNVAVTELPWRPADLEQALDRTHRIGQVNPVTAWHLLVPGTADAAVYKVIEKKRRIAGKVLGEASPDEDDKGLVGSYIEALKEEVA